MKIPQSMGVRFKLALLPFLRQVYQEGGLRILLGHDWSDGARRWKADLEGGCFEIRAYPTCFEVRCAQKVRGQWVEIYFWLMKDYTQQTIVIPRKMRPHVDLSLAENMIRDIVRGWPVTREARRAALQITKRMQRQT